MYTIVLACHASQIVKINQSKPAWQDILPFLGHKAFQRVCVCASQQRPCVDNMFSAVNAN